MARKIHQLKAIQVARSRKSGLLADGGGLYLQVSDAGAKSWLFRFMLAGRARAMGLGSLNTISLAEAREEAARCRKLLREKIDPIEARNTSRGQAALEAAKSITFEQCARAYIEAHGAGWKNAKHARQWENTLSTYAYPVFGSLPVAGVDTALVMRCLEPIWKKRPETASRLRGRVESVLDEVEHHAALPYAEISAFVAELRRQPGAAARALEFTILPAIRTGEVLGAE